MNKKAWQTIDAVLDQLSYSFMIIDVRFRDEADLTGLLRNELDNLLPHGLEDNLFFFQRVGRSMRFVVTIVKPPIVGSFNPNRIKLPFATIITVKGDYSIIKKIGGRAYCITYGNGLIRSISLFKSSPNSNQELLCSSSKPIELNTPSIQYKTGSALHRWQLVTAVLAITFLMQVSLICIGSIRIRQARLEILDQYINHLELSGYTQKTIGNGTTESGYQDRAVDIARSVSGAWLKNSYLTSFTLKSDRLRIEGWGQRALDLLSSLKSDPKLQGLGLSTSNTRDGVDFFVFEGALNND